MSSSNSLAAAADHQPDYSGQGPAKTQEAARWIGYRVVANAMSSISSGLRHLCQKIDNAARGLGFKSNPSIVQISMTELQKHIKILKIEFENEKYEKNLNLFNEWHTSSSAEKCSKDGSLSVKRKLQKAKEFGDIPTTTLEAIVKEHEAAKVIETAKAIDVQFRKKCRDACALVDTAKGTSGFEKWGLAFLFSLNDVSAPLAKAKAKLLRLEEDLTREEVGSTTELREATKPVITEIIQLVKTRFSQMEKSQDAMDSTVLYEYHLETTALREALRQFKEIVT